MKFSLAKKFKAFVANLEGYENLDLLLKNTREGRRGDYLFRRRVIVAEQKEQNSEASEVDPIPWDRNPGELRETPASSNSPDPCAGTTKL